MEPFDLINGRNALRRARIAEVESLADLKVKRIEDFFEERRGDLAAASDYYVVEENLPRLNRIKTDLADPSYLKTKRELDDKLVSLQKEYGYDNILLVNLQGRVVYCTNASHLAYYLGKPLPDPGDRAFQNGRKSIYFTDIFKNPLEPDHYSMMVSAPVIDEKQRLIGVIAFGVRMDSIYSMIMDTTGLGKTGETFVVKAVQGGALFISPPKHHPEQVFTRVIKLGSKIGIPAQRAVMKENGSGESIDYMGYKIIAAWRYIPSRDWGLVVKMDTSEAYAEIYRTIKVQLLFLAAALAAGALVSFGLSRSLTKPIRSLEKGAQIIGQGNLDYKVGTEAKDEIGQLSRAFDRMTESLKKVTASRDDLEKEIAERKRVEEALRAASQYARSLLESSLDPLVTISAEGKITDANCAAEEATGVPRDKLIGSDFSNYFTEPDKAREGYKKVFTQGEVRNYPLAIRHVSGKITEVIYNATVYRDEQGKVKGVFAAARDITERIKLQEQLQQAMKMEAIGRLAGGVAHDFNNNLTPIFGTCELLLNELSPDHPVYKDLVEIKEAAERCASLVRQLMAFSRKQMLEPRIISLNAVVNNMEKMLRRVIGEDIKLEKNLDPLLGSVKADVGQMEQILLNLAVNARDAMPEGGKLTLSTAHAEPDPNFLKSHIDFKPVKYATLSITDTGSGMDEKTRANIFEPFFTTKAVGKGTGLGLSTVYGIVKQSGGNILVSSEPGKGATFSIYLPLAEETAKEAEAQKTAAAPTRGAETVLVVEDDPNVMKVIRRGLKLMGYQVLEARNGQEALQVSEKSDGHIDLMLTDVVMPGMSGKDLATRFRDRTPNLKIIYMSGYSDLPAVREDPASQTFFIQKPFDIETLARKIREVLDC